MDDDLKQVLQSMLDTQKETLRLCHEAKVEAAVLQGVCASLVATVAKDGNDPQAKLDQILASVQGTGMAVAEGTKSIHFTATLEQICEMAEALMPYS